MSGASADCGRTLLQLILVITLACAFVSQCQGQGVDPELVSVKWGVADTTATVGKLLRIHIPSDAFNGDVKSFAVNSVDSPALPSWLEFDAKDSVLQGVPGPKDVGQLFLEVTAFSKKNKASVNFGIFVHSLASHTSGVPLKFKSSGPEFVRCKRSEPETVATIILDVDMEGTPVSERISLLRKFLSHMNLHEDMIKMVPVGNSPMHDSSALVSGTGDSTSPKTAGLFISWPVGCGQVKEGHFPVLQRLDDDSTSGKMAGVLGCPVIGWHVTNSHIQPLVRKRREVKATATSGPTPVVPTKTSKEDDAKTDDGMVHTVVEMGSPTIIQPTATQPPMTKTELPDSKEDKEMPDKEMPDKEKPDKEMPEKVVPSETGPVVAPVEKTKTPVIMPTKTHDVGEPTDGPVIDLGPKDDCVMGQKPKVANAFSKIAVNVGDVIDRTIRADTFEDCEVGGTRELELTLLKDTTDKIPSDFFIQFDKENQRIFGLPMENNIGRHKFNLVARKKSNGLLSNFDFMIVVRGGKKDKKKINHELSVAVDYDYDKFMANVATRAQLAKNVASIYGDSDTSNLVITTMKRGSVVYGWANKTLSSNKCPVGGISDMVDKLVNPDGSLTDNAIEKLKPFVLIGAAAEPAGACEGDPSFPAVVSKPRVLDKDKDDDKKPMVTDKPTMKPDDTKEDKDEDDKKMAVTDKPTMKPDEKDDTDDTKDDKDMGAKPTDKPAETTTDEKRAEKTKEDDDDDVWITTVVPAVVIVVILLIALLIACILYRKKRKGKMNVEEQNTFINKGAPVIFPDELEEKPGDVNKPLLVEGGPTPPPEYHRDTSESPESNVANNHRNNPGSPPPQYDDGITEMPEKPYEPPPPVTASSNNKQPRPTHQQQPFSQPPQILP